MRTAYVTHPDCRNHDTGPGHPERAHWLPALQAFQPEMVFVSAGYDAHRYDDMSHVALTDADFK